MPEEELNNQKSEEEKEGVSESKDYVHTNQEDSEHSSRGPVIAIVIILIILIAVGTYFFLGRVPEQNRNTLVETGAEDVEILTSDTMTEALNSQGTSDALNEIEEDVASTDLEGLDAELKAIESELGEVF